MKKLLVLFLLLSTLVFATPKIEFAFADDPKGQHYICIRCDNVKSFILVSDINPEYIVHFPDYPNWWYIRIPQNVTKVPELQFLMDGKLITTQEVDIPAEYQNKVGPNGHLFRIG